MESDDIEPTEWENPREWLDHLTSKIISTEYPDNTNRMWKNSCEELTDIAKTIRHSEYKYNNDQLEKINQ